MRTRVAVLLRSSFHHYLEALSASFHQSTLSVRMVRLDDPSVQLTRYHRAHDHSSLYRSRYLYAITFYIRRCQSDCPAPLNPRQLFTQTLQASILRLSPSLSIISQRGFRFRTSSAWQEFPAYSGSTASVSRSPPHPPRLLASRPLGARRPTFLRVRSAPQDQMSTMVTPGSPQIPPS